MFDDYEVLSAGPPISEVGLTALEERHGRVFPASFRQFLFWRNGGVPRKKGWPITIAGWVRLSWPPGSERNDPKSDIGDIFKVEPDSPNFDHFDYVYDAYDNLPPNILPVASDSGGDLYFMDLSEGPEPRVLYAAYLVPHQAALVAKNFIGFLDALTREDEI